MDTFSHSHIQPVRVDIIFILPRDKVRLRNMEEDIQVHGILKWLKLEFSLLPHHGLSYYAYALSKARMM